MCAPHTPFENFRATFFIHSNRISLTQYTIIMATYQMATGLSVLLLFLNILEIFCIVIEVSSIIVELEHMSIDYNDTYY